VAVAILGMGQKKEGSEREKRNTSDLGYMCIVRRHTSGSHTTTEVFPPVLPPPC